MKYKNVKPKLKFKTDIDMDVTEYINSHGYLIANIMTVEEQNEIKKLAKDEKTKKKIEDGRTGKSLF